MSSHFFRLQQPHQISFSSNSHHQVDIPFLPRKPQGPIHHHEQQQQATIFHLSTGCRRLLQNVPTRTGTYWRRLGLAHTEDYYDWHILKTTRTGTYWRLLGLAHTEDYYVGQNHVPRAHSECALGTWWFCSSAPTSETEARGQQWLHGTALQEQLWDKMEDLQTTTFRQTTRLTIWGSTMLG